MGISIQHSENTYYSILLSKAVELLLLSKVFVQFFHAISIYLITFPSTLALFLCCRCFSVEYTIRCCHFYVVDIPISFGVYVPHTINLIVVRTNSPIIPSLDYSFTTRLPFLTDHFIFLLLFSK